MQSTLIHDIEREGNRLISIVASIPAARRKLKVIDGTGGKVRVADLMAYQISTRCRPIKGQRNG